MQRCNYGRSWNLEMRRRPCGDWLIYSSANAINYYIMLLFCYYGYSSLDLGRRAWISLPNIHLRKRARLLCSNCSRCWMSRHVDGTLRIVDIAENPGFLTWLLHYPSLGTLIMKILRMLYGICWKSGFKEGQEISCTFNPWSTKWCGLWHAKQQLSHTLLTILWLLFYLYLFESTMEKRKKCLDTLHRRPTTLLIISAETFIIRTGENEPNLLIIVCPSRYQVLISHAILQDLVFNW